MAVNYQIVEAGGTSTDVLLSFNGMKAIIEMTNYKSGIHFFNRSGALVREEVTLTSDSGVDINVSVYLVDDDTPEGQFVIDRCRIGIDDPLSPDKLVMFIGEFIIPAGFSGDLNSLDIKAIRVV